MRGSQQRGFVRSIHLPADVDNLTVAAHWFDRRHDNTGELADIDLKVKVYNDYGVIHGTYYSSASNSSKERVHYPMNLVNTEMHAKLTLKGYSVSSNNAGCGSNSMKVYISWYYEDNDRDDGNGPGMEILPQ